MMIYSGWINSLLEDRAVKTSSTFSSCAVLVLHQVTM